LAKKGEKNEVKAEDSKFEEPQILITQPQTDIFNDGFDENLAQILIERSEHFNPYGDMRLTWSWTSMQKSYLGFPVD